MDGNLAKNQKPVYITLVVQLTANSQLYVLSEADDKFYFSCQGEIV